MIEIIRKRHQGQRLIPIFRGRFARRDVVETTRVDDQPVVRERVPVGLGEGREHLFPGLAETAFLLREKLLVSTLVRSEGSIFLWKSVPLSRR